MVSNRGELDECQALEYEDRGPSMSLTEVVVEGTVQPDGTLVLAQKPGLPAGQVTVVLRQRDARNESGWDQNLFQAMEEIWAAQQARGFVPRSAEEVERERRELRRECAEEVEAAIRLQQESRRLRQQADSGKGRS
jgi:hypothetical protein